MGIIEKSGKAGISRSSPQTILLYVAVVLIVALQLPLAGANPVSVAMLLNTHDHECNVITLWLAVCEHRHCPEDVVNDLL